MAYNLYPEVLEVGYRKYISKLFGFYYSMSGQCEYEFMSKESDNLIAYLDSITGTELLTVKDREPLINAIHATNRKGKLLKDIETLNGVLKEYGLPHRIMEYSTTVESKRYRHAWKVMNPKQALSR